MSYLCKRGGHVVGLHGHGQVSTITKVSRKNESLPIILRGWEFGVFLKRKLFRNNQGFKKIPRLGNKFGVCKNDGNPQMIMAVICSGEITAKLIPNDGQYPWLVNQFES